MTLLSAGCSVFETVIDIRLFFFLKKKIWIRNIVHEPKAV